MGDATTFLRKGCRLMPQPARPMADKDAESIETEHVGIVSLAGLIARMVEIDGKDDAPHEEEGEDHPKYFLVIGEDDES